MKHCLHLLTIELYVNFR